MEFVVSGALVSGVGLYVESSEVWSMRTSKEYRYKAVKYESMTEEFERCVYDGGALVFCFRSSFRVVVMLGDILPCEETCGLRTSATKEYGSRVGNKLFLY